MGEVYRARDTRLGREVAVKVLPAAICADPERLRRFEQEARAAGMLNHPNILAIYDVGTYQGSPYVVSELLEGETLRERQGGAALPPRKAIEYAVPITQGLAAAHDKGIVHRDLKPENLFLTKDERVKILDFGLAKLTRPEAVSGEEAATISAKTRPGAVLGTVGYMSPEQVRGQPADHRADIFSFGVILYEMLSGRRAFRGNSAVEMMNAILKEEPPELSGTDRNIPPGLERVVRRCLEKSPEARFQSARDLGFALETLSGLSVATPAVSAPAPAQPGRRLLLLLLGLGLLAMLVVFSTGRRMGFVAGEKAAERPPPVYHLLTFRRGTIQSARFAPDGHTIIYAAAWDGRPYELFSTRPESPESRSFGLPSAEILSVSSTGEMAILLNQRAAGFMFWLGTLARVPLAGGAPREILENVQWGDWAPDGKSLAVVRYVEGRSRLEFPIGKVLYETTGLIFMPRISPKGDQIAFFERPLGPGGWSLGVVDLAQKKRILFREWYSAWGLAWSPAGEEIWCTGAEKGLAGALYALSLSGQQRLVERVPATLALRDISREGRVLLISQNFRGATMGLAPGETRERDLSWLDGSLAADLSADGKTLLFAELGAGVRVGSEVYLRKTDGSPAVRLGEGMPVALAPDGKWALVIQQGPRPQLVLLPTGAGESKTLRNETIQEYSWASWFPDGERILFAGSQTGHGSRLYVQDLAGGKPVAITPEGAGIQAGLFRGGSVSISADGRLVAALGPEQKVALYQVEGGAPRQIPGAAAGEFPIRWTADGRALYLSRPQERPAKIYRLDISSGRKELWKEILPSDPAGLYDIPRILLTADGKSYAYSYARLLSELYLVEGLK